MKKIVRDLHLRSFFDSKQAREIIILKKLSKSNSDEKDYIVGYIDFFLVNGDDFNFYLVMELCDVIYIYKFYIIS